MRKIGIIGAGAMGTGIAQVASLAGTQVVVCEIFSDTLAERSASLLQAGLEKMVSRNKLDRTEAGKTLSRVTYADRLEALEGCQLVIEAVVEDLETKKSVFEQLEQLVSPDCLLATNTSSLSVTAIAASCRHPHRTLGIHFFNPAPVMQLVEIIPALQTAEESVITALDTIRAWGKTAIRAKDTPGFLVNRIARHYYGEALRIYDEGLAEPATVDWAMTTFGKFRMGPFSLMDLIGNDVNHTVSETMFRAFYHDPRYKPSLAQRQRREAGWLGRKTGRGFYDYTAGAPQPEPSTDTAGGERIFRRILAMLINEAAEACYLRIATREEIDLAVTLGVNYPKGLLRWADETGIATCVKWMDELYNHYLEDRYRCSPLLRKMAREGSRFFEQP
ncbi:MAG: hypothetical protein RLY31_2620 [Bacteroidota bacterium]|jgi:3-hydroxybutyryl-CoA dehydrogenase